MKRLLRKLRHEPVAALGGPVAAALIVLPEVGISAHWVAVLTGVCLALGIPIVRAQVTPTAAIGDSGNPQMGAP